MQELPAHPITGTVLDDDRAATLARQIRQDHEEVTTKGKDILRKAIDIGEASLEARTIVPRGEWTGWLHEHAGLSLSTVYMYEKVAMGRELILAHLDAGEPLRSLRAAIHYIDNHAIGTGTSEPFSQERIAKSIAKRKAAALARIEIDDGMIQRTADWFVTKFPSTFNKWPARKRKIISEEWAASILLRIFMKANQR